MDLHRAVIERIKDIIELKGITVNEAAVRSKVPPSTLKNILYGNSRNVGIVRHWSMLCSYWCKSTVTTDEGHVVKSKYKNYYIG